MSAYNTQQAQPTGLTQRDATPLIPGHQSSLNPLAPHTAQNPITGNQHVSHNPMTQGQDPMQQNHSSLNPLNHNTNQDHTTANAHHSMNPLAHHDNNTAAGHHSLNPLASHHNNSTTHAGSHVPQAANAAATGAAAAAHHDGQHHHHSLNPLHRHSTDHTVANPQQTSTGQHHHSMNPLHHKTDMATGAALAHHNSSNKTFAHNNSNATTGAARPTKSHWWNKRTRLGRVEFGVREALSMLLVLGTMALTIWMMSLSRWAAVPTVSGGTAHIGLRSDRITQAPGVAPGAQVDNTILAGGANFRRGGTAVIVLGSLALLCATLSILMFLCSVCRRANLRGAVALRRFTILMVFMASALTTLAFLIYSYYLSSDVAFIAFALCSFLYTLAGLGLLAGAPESVRHSHHSMMPASSSKHHSIAATQPNTGVNTAANSPRHYNNTAQMV